MPACRGVGRRAAGHALVIAVVLVFVAGSLAASDGSARRQHRSAMRVAVARPLRQPKTLKMRWSEEEKDELAEARAEAEKRDVAAEQRRLHMKRTMTGPDAGKPVKAGPVYEPTYHGPRTQRSLENADRVARGLEPVFEEAPGVRISDAMRVHNGLSPQQARRARAMHARAISEAGGDSVARFTAFTTTEPVPDPTLSVGPSQIALFMNGVVGLYDKATRIPMTQEGLNFFFNDDEVENPYDPRTVFDHHNERFVAMEIDNINFEPYSSTATISVTKSSEANDLVENGNAGLGSGSWQAWVFSPDHEIFSADADPQKVEFQCDYPQFTYDQYNIYLVCTMFSNPGQTPSFYAKGMWIKSQQMYPPGQAAVGAHKLKWAETYALDDPYIAGCGHTNPDGLANLGHPIVCIDFKENPTNAWALAITEYCDRRLLLFQIPGPINLNPTNAANILPFGINMEPSWRAPAPDSLGLHPPFAEQKNEARRIDTLDFRITAAVHREDIAWVCHTIPSQGNPSTRAVVRWYKVNVLARTIIQQGDLEDDNVAFFFPAITINKEKTVVVSMAGSSASYFPSAFVARKYDVRGNFEPIQLIKRGKSPYTLTTNTGFIAWGDINTIVVDPSNGKWVWTAAGHCSTTTTISFDVYGECPGCDICPGGITCNGNGQCNLETGECTCDDGWTGDGCQKRGLGLILDPLSVAAIAIGGAALLSGGGYMWWKYYENQQEAIHTDSILRASLGTALSTGSVDYSTWTSSVASSRGYSTAKSKGWYRTKFGSEATDYGTPRTEGGHAFYPSGREKDAYDDGYGRDKSKYIKSQYSGISSATRGERVSEYSGKSGKTFMDTAGSNATWTGVSGASLYTQGKSSSGSRGSGTRSGSSGSRSGGYKTSSSGMRSGSSGSRSGGYKTSSSGMRSGSSGSRSGGYSSKKSGSSGSRSGGYSSKNSHGSRGGYSSKKSTGSRSGGFSSKKSSNSRR